MDARRYLIGLAVAPITGAVTAARIRLPRLGLYALPVLLAVLGSLAPVLPNILTSGLLVYLGGNALIAVATARLPRRPENRA